MKRILMTIAVIFVTALPASASCNVPAGYGNGNTCMVDPFTVGMDAGTWKADEQAKIGFQYVAGSANSGVYPFPMPDETHNSGVFSAVTGPRQFNKAPQSTWTVPHVMVNAGTMVDVETFVTMPESIWVSDPVGVKIVEFVDSMPFNAFTYDQYVVVADAMPMEANWIGVAGSFSEIFADICPAPPPLCPTCPPIPVAFNSFGSMEVQPVGHAGAGQMQVTRCRQ